MKHEIKNRFTGKVLFTCEVPDGLESGMITRHADLSNADLRGANLSGAKNAPLIINGLHWIVLINGFGMMQIGCQNHKVEEWASFNDDQISAMDSHALEFWEKNKEMLLSICDSYKHESE